MRSLILFLLLISSFQFTFADDAEAYIKKYRKVAIKEMKKYGIPASITLAHGMLESGNGKSRLAKKGKNHFGIKCTNDWEGRTIKEDDDKKNECFRRYRKAEHSYRDHSEFIANRERYRFLFEYDKKDYKSWAYGLKQAGYATNPKYPELIINIIDRYDLHKYDKKYAKREIKKEEKLEKKVAKKLDVKYEYHTVDKGDTLYSIAKKYNVDFEELKKMNSKSSNNIFIGEKIRIK